MLEHTFGDELLKSLSSARVSTYRSEPQVKEVEQMLEYFKSLEDTWSKVHLLRKDSDLSQLLTHEILQITVFH